VVIYAGSCLGSFYFALVINSAVIIRESAAAKKRFLLGKLVSGQLLCFTPFIEKRVCFIATDFNGKTSVLRWLVSFP
jgi:hypothetical protein